MPLIQVPCWPTLCPPCRNAAHGRVTCWADSTLWMKKAPYLRQTQSLAEGTGWGEQSKVDFSPQPTHLCTVGIPVKQQNRKGSGSTSNSEVLVHRPMLSVLEAGVLRQGWGWVHMEDHYSGFPSVYSSKLTQGSRSSFLGRNSRLDSQSTGEKGCQF